ncbi:uncharacterized protein KGF55_004630 [Candida pseudojiufengensis]|uniref:uncharacterized protein n=1 Tax=Candida pseudojiufengensis TaxID=497109 RepID=UPI0022241FFB|nr:uncharacterized protein KGF55_004630 [Candida pseudojiufengensis]KAI5960338.1 hypothetical protein KGF55_004630 [Candida pseudojiufengensis]
MNQYLEAVLCNVTNASDVDNGVINNDANNSCDEIVDNVRKEIHPVSLTVHKQNPENADNIREVRKCATDGLYRKMGAKSRSFRNISKKLYSYTKRTENADALVNILITKLLLDFDVNAPEVLFGFSDHRINKNVKKIKDFGNFLNIDVTKAHVMNRETLCLDIIVEAIITFSNAFICEEELDPINLMKHIEQKVIGVRYNEVEFETPDSALEKSYGNKSENDDASTEYYTANNANENDMTNVENIN